MKISKTFANTYLNAKDIEGDSLELVIDEVIEAEIAGEDRLVAVFKDFEKSLALNKTNALEIASGYGDETDDWSGKSIVLVKEKTMFQGKRVPCVRVEIPKAEKKIVDKPF